MSYDTNSVFAYIESTKVKLHWWPYRVVYDYRHPHSQSLKSREARETRKVHAEPQAGMTCISLPLPKFIRRYLSVRMNREQKSIPYATTSHKQRGSRDLHRGRRAGCLSLFSRRWGVREWVYKRDAQQLLHSLPSSSPL